MATSAELGSVSEITFLPSNGHLSLPINNFGLLAPSNSAIEIQYRIDTKVIDIFRTFF